MKNLKIGIQHSPGSFSGGWLEYCQKNGIDYKLVNCYANDIIEQLKDCDALMWHFHHANPRDVKFAKQLLYSVQAIGKKVLPDFNTVWHFDDKVGQKYLLEAIEAPLVPSWVFYTKTEALAWAGKAAFPKVFKLRGGAGSQNVKLVKTNRQATRLIKKAFGKGFRQYDARGNLKERWRKLLLGKGSLKEVVKGLIRFIYPPEFSKISGREKGYVYFQDFIPNNRFDVRIVIIGEKALGEKRFVRENDFRASGSGVFSYEGIDLETIQIAFNIATKLKTQSLAFDFIYDKDNKPLIVEISYGFGTEGISKAPGYWDKELKWHKGPIDPFGWMVDLIRKNN